MTEVQPDMLGGKTRSASSLPRVRRRGVAKPQPAGHYDKPGTGPVGETCGGCTYMETFHYAKTYHKCGAKPGHHWKGGRATDIRPMDAACSRFERTIRQITEGTQPIAPAADIGAALDSAASRGETVIETPAGRLFVAFSRGYTPNRGKADDHGQASLFD